MSNQYNSSSQRKPVRVWVDGCFDMVHFGHANALRQAKGLGDQLLVGVHSDDEIRYHKGPPVFNESERYHLVRSIKWVDQVVENAPYITSVETLKEYNCDFCAHGDDITTSADGHDTYHLVKAAGMYKEFKRTEGVSTTDLVSRMLRATRQQAGGQCGDGQKPKNVEEGSVKAAEASPYTTSCPFVATAQRLAQFAGQRPHRPGEKVVYVCGAFDLFHLGHIQFLEKCYEIGTYIVVGLHSDATIAWYRGENYPIMRIFERVLSVLACKYVADVVIDAPYVITKELLSHLQVDHVVQGKRTKVSPCSDGSDPYAAAKSLGLYREVDSGSSLTTHSVIQRIVQNEAEFEERNRKKEQKETTMLSG